MTQVENNRNSIEFNALRGGIFADEPGLGNHRKAQQRINR